MEATQPDNLNAFTQIDSLLNELRAILLMNISTHGAITAQIKSLDGEDTLNASPYWLNGVYLYLVHPQTPEKKRWRQYVGNDPARVEKALQRVSRSKRHARLSKEKCEMERRANCLVRQLTKSINLSQGKYQQGDINERTE